VEAEVRKNFDGKSTTMKRMMSSYLSMETSAEGLENLTLFLLCMIEKVAR
jgi:hypothetical protein